MNRLSIVIESGTKLLVAYLMPEYPFKHATISALFALEKSGVNIIEVGMPHSDPIADGSIIQEAAQLAIKNGATLKNVLSLIKDARAQGLKTAIVLMGYFNPILRYGVSEFLAEARSSGVDGFIIPDLPPEESQLFREKVIENGLGMTFIISPVTTSKRIQLIDSLSTHFSYALAVNATTGTAKLSNETIYNQLEIYLERVRGNANKKFIVGFGVQTKAQLDWIVQHADGAVIGSAYLRCIQSATSEEEISTNTYDFWRSIQR